MNKSKKNTILMETDGIRDWLEHVEKTIKKKEYRLTETVDINGKKKLNYDIKSWGEEDSEINKNVLRFPYKFTRLKIKNHDELIESMCEQIVELKNNNVKNKKYIRLE